MSQAQPKKPRAERRAHNLLFIHCAYMHVCISVQDKFFPKMMRRLGVIFWGGFHNLANHVGIIFRALWNGPQIMPNLLERGRGLSLEGPCSYLCEKMMYAPHSSIASTCFGMCLFSLVSVAF